MASLSTVYAISLILGSLAAIGSAFAGTYVYPLQTGGTVGELAEAVKDAATTVNETVTEATTPAEEPLKTEVESQPEIKNTEMTNIKCDDTEFGTVCLYKPTSNQHDKVVYSETLPTEYFEEQNAFYKKLTEDEKAILKSYSLYGDKILNSLLRKDYSENLLLNYISLIRDKHGDDTVKSLFGVTFSDINKENVLSISNAYLTKFMNTFNKVPTVNKEFTVFRGTKEPTPQFGGFLSTTYDPLGYQLNLFSGPSCCVYELKIKKGVRALWMAPVSQFDTEHEIIISPYTTISILKETTKEVWKAGRTISKTTKTVYECVVKESASAGGSDGGAKKLPVWFRHSSRTQE